MTNGRKSQKVVIVTSLEPIMGALMAFVVLVESPFLLTAAGAAIIFLGVLQITRGQAK